MKELLKRLNDWVSSKGELVKVGFAFGMFVVMSIVMNAAFKLLFSMAGITV